MNNYYYKKLSFETIKKNIKSQVAEFEKSQLHIESIKNGNVEEISEDDYNKLNEKDQEKFFKESRMSGYNSETYYRLKTIKDDIKESIEKNKNKIIKNIKSKTRYDISSVNKLPQFSVIQDEYNLLDTGKYIQLSESEYNDYTYLVQEIENNLKQLE